MVAFERETYFAEETVAIERAYPLNAWYPAAWSHEVGRALFARKICDENLVFYRREDGVAVALEDACWHRLLPLSLGRLRGDEVVCGYHGLVFNSAGRCSFMPAQKTINPSASVRSFPVVERHRLLWVWPGDPALADPAKLPDFHWNDGTEWVGDGGTFVSLKCDWRLVVDNLMDLTHETYVHSDSIGHDAILDSPFEATHDDRTATLTRWMIGIEPPPFWAKQLGKPGLVDRWQIVRFEAPAVCVGDVGVAPAGTGAREGDPRPRRQRRLSRRAGRRRRRRVAITSGTLCARSSATIPSCRRALQRAHVNDGHGVYDQDHRVLEAQQRAILENPRQPFYNLNIDAGALWARRLIEDLAARERPRAAAE